MAHCSLAEGAGHSETFYLSVSAPQSCGRFSLQCSLVRGYGYFAFMGGSLVVLCLIRSATEQHRVRPLEVRKMTKDLKERMAVNIEPTTGFCQPMDWSTATIILSHESIEIRIGLKKNYTLPRTSIQSISKGFQRFDFFFASPRFTIKTNMASSPSTFILAPWFFSKLEAYLKRLGYTVEFGES